MEFDKVNLDRIRYCVKSTHLYNAHILYRSILMSQKKTLGTVTECTEICDDSVSLLGDTNLSVLNSARLLIGKEQIFIRIQMFLANLMRFKLFFFSFERRSIL